MQVSFAIFIQKKQKNIHKIKKNHNRELAGATIRIVVIFLPIESEQVFTCGKNM